MGKSKKKYILWADYAKGIGIILVVIGHVVRGLVNANLIEKTPVVSFCHDWIYSFHMPLFFVVNGLFLQSALDKKFIPALKIKAGNILYPYFIWATLQTSIQIIMSSHTNNPLSIYDIFSLVYKPIMQFWFLYVLFILFWLIYILYSIRLSSMQIVTISLVIFVLPQFMGLGDWGVLYLSINNLPFVATGYLLASVIHDWLKNLKANVLALCCLVAFFVISVFTYYDFEFNRWFYLSTGLIGTAGVILLSKLLTRGKMIFILKHIGHYSLEIFVAHTIASAGIRIILQKVFNIENQYIHIFLGILFGILGPLILVELLRKIGFKYAFSLKIKK